MAKILLLNVTHEGGVSKLLSSYSTTFPLDSITSHLLKAISPTLLPALTHIINTSLLMHLPHCIQAGLGNPTAQKNLQSNTSLIDSYRPVSLLAFIVKMLERVVFN